MALEGDPNNQNLIGDMPFGITTESISDHLRALQEDLARINEGLAQNNLPQMMREFCEKLKLRNEEILKVPPDEVLRLLREVYDFVHALEQSGVARSDIPQRIYGERPELRQAIRKFNIVLEVGAVWGYRLSQEVLAFQPPRA